MIRYALRCAEGHVFDSWFQSAAAYDRLAATGRLNCAVCGGADVEKTLMAPAVASAPAPEAASPAAPAAPAAATAPMLSSPSHPLEVALRALRTQVEANAEHVGPDFARRARAMHDGEDAARAIYGEATVAEARELIEDGVPVAPLPWLTRRDD